MRYALVLLPLWLALTGNGEAKVVGANTREHLITGYTTIFRYWDKDGDRKLSYAEVVTMVNETAARMKEQFTDGKPHPEIEDQRVEFIAYYESQDTNHHGYLTLDEFLRPPLASFECMDENHDGVLSQDEIAKGMDQCPSLNLQDYAPKR